MYYLSYQVCLGFTKFANALLSFVNMHTGLLLMLLSMIYCMMFVTVLGPGYKNTSIQFRN